MSSETCVWCHRDIGPEEGFRAYETPGMRCAVFCRLEHIVPWRIRGSHWPAGEAGMPAAGEAPARCSQCDAELGEAHVLLVHHRGEHRIPDGFCSLEHMSDWAKAGGRWK